MTTALKLLVKINQQAIRLLCEELGVVNTVRCLRQFTTSLGYYTKERKTLFAGKSLHEIVEEIEQQE